MTHEEYKVILVLLNELLDEPQPEVKIQKPQIENQVPTSVSFDASADPYRTEVMIKRPYSRPSFVSQTRQCNHAPFKKGSTIDKSSGRCMACNKEMLFVPVDPRIINSEAGYSTLGIYLAVFGMGVIALLLPNVVDYLYHLIP
jgi:hypothetical protein